jgi:hypothetical protein
MRLAGHVALVGRSCMYIGFWWKSQKERLKSETVKYGREYQGTRTRERLRWQGSATCTNDRPVLSSERAPHKNKAVTVK